MKSRVLLTSLSVAALLVASSSLQPAFALTKAQASVLCVMIKFQQCPQAKSGLDHFAWCKQMGFVPYAGGSVSCCKQWTCGYIH